MITHSPCQLGPCRWEHPLHCVAFDMDGLLLNTEDLYKEVIEEMLSTRGKVFHPEVRKRMMGQPAKKAWTVLKEGAQLQESWEELHEEGEAMFLRLLPDRVDLMPGVVEILQFLHVRSIPCCVATSSQRNIAEDSLSRLDIRSRFEFIVTAEDVLNGKPAPDIYLMAAKRLGVSTQSMLVLEDSSNGAKAGVSAGACVIAVPSIHSLDHDFSGVACIAQSLHDPRLYALLAGE